MESWYVIKNKKEKKGSLTCPSLKKGLHWGVMGAMQLSGAELILFSWLFVTWIKRLVWTDFDTESKNWKKKKNKISGYFISEKVNDQCNIQGMTEGNGGGGVEGMESPRWWGEVVPLKQNRSVCKIREMSHVKRKIFQKCDCIQHIVEPFWLCGRLTQLLFFRSFDFCYECCTTRGYSVHSILRAVDWTRFNERPFTYASQQITRSWLATTITFERSKIKKLNTLNELIPA